MINTSIHYHKNLGFNLLEVLLVVLIIAFSFKVAIPSYLSLQEKMTQTAEVNRVLSLINQFRGLASLRKSPLTICPSNNGTSCTSYDLAQGGLLVKDEASQQVLHFSPPSGYTVAMLPNPAVIQPLPRRTGGSSFLPCTGFRFTQPKALTLSSSSRARINNAPAASLIAHCSN